MPNHVTTICTITGPLAAITAFVEHHIRADVEHAGRRGFDFNTVIARPAILDGNNSPPASKAELGMAALVGDLVWTDFRRYLVPNYELPAHTLTGPPVQHARQVREWLAAERPEVLEAGRRYLAAIVETGYPTWYEWSIANWDTKWNAYSYEERGSSIEPGDACEFVFKFETAWSFPEPVFRKLAELYPTLVLAVISYDEGSNFACAGEFNGRNDYRCSKELVTPEMYERVYGEKPERDDEDS